MKRPLLCLTLALLTAATALSAEEPRQRDDRPSGPEGAYQAYLKASQPGPEHQTLAGLEGDFSLTSRFWQGPGGAPEITELQAHRTLENGGRVLRLTVADGDRFEGTGLMGYDTVGEKFWYLWTDTTTTGLSRAEGSLDRRGAGTLEGSQPTPFGPVPLRMEISFEQSVEVHRYYVSEQDGERQFLELRYRPRMRRD